MEQLNGKLVVRWNIWKDELLRGLKISILYIVNSAAT